MKVNFIRDKIFLVLFMIEIYLFIYTENVKRVFFTGFFFKNQLSLRAKNFNSNKFRDGITIRTKRLIEARLFSFQDLIMLGKRSFSRVCLLD